MPLPVLRARAGQAMVEFAVALVAVIVLLAGLIQVGRLAQVHTRTLIDARQDAARRAMSDTPPLTEAPRIVSDWTPGPDGRRYTADDAVRLTTNALGMAAGLAARARLGRLAPAPPPNPVSRLAESRTAGGDFGLVQGTAADSVPTLPVIRHLVYPREAIDLETDVWLVWTEGLLGGQP